MSQLQSACPKGRKKAKLSLPQMGRAGETTNGHICVGSVLFLMACLMILDHTNGS